MTARNAPGEITKRNFCDTFGISEAQLERLFQQGFPHRKASSRKIMIPMPAGRVFYHEYLVKKGERKAKPSTIDDARLMKESATAELEQLKLARERGLTMKVEDHERLLADAFARVRAKLVNLAPRAAGAAFGAETLQACQAAIEPVVDELMDELCKADDVPEPEEGDEAEAA